MTVTADQDQVGVAMLRAFRIRAISRAGLPASSSNNGASGGVKVLGYDVTKIGCRTAAAPRSNLGDGGGHASESVTATDNG